MAITTADGLLAGSRPPALIAKALSGALVAGRPHSYWYQAGIPGAGAVPTGLTGTALSSTSAPVAGQIAHTDPVSGNAYLAYLSAIASQPGLLMVCDRLWHNGGYTITATTAQTVNSVAWPARDQNDSTNGAGVFLGLEVSGAVGAGTPTLTVGYTNSDNTAGRTAANIQATVASSIAGSFYQIGVQSGDVGVRSVQNLTLSASWTSGTISLVAYRLLKSILLSGAGVPTIMDAIAMGMTKLSPGVVPFLIFVPSTTTSTSVMGEYTESHG